MSDNNPGKTRRVLAGLVTLTVAATLATASLSPAGASSANLTYNCGTDGIYGQHGASVKWNTDAPDVVYVGDAPVEIGVTAAALLDDKFSKHLYWNRVARRGAGTSAVNGSVDDDSRTWSMAAQVPRIASSGNTAMSMSGALGEFSPPGTPGMAPINVGQFRATMTFASGANSNIGGDFTCVPRSGQNTLVDTITVMSRSTTALTVNNVGEGEAPRAVAVVSTDGGSPAGRVDFTVDGTTVEVPVANGQAAADLPVMPAGTYSVSATFVPANPDLYEGSTGTKVLKVAAAQSTSTTLNLSDNTTPAGQPPVATASVESGTGDLPQGKVAFEVANGDSIEADLVDGSASITLPNLPSGSRAVTAEFIPTNASEFAGSRSASSTWRIQATSTTSLSLDSSVVGPEQRARVSARVTTSDGTPTGEVVFSAGGNDVYAAVENGVATAELPVLAPGEYDVSADFNPIDTLGVRPSSSSTRQLTVKVGTVEEETSTPTSLRMSVNHVRSTYGQALRANADVDPRATGTVRFVIAGLVKTVAIINGTASVDVPRLAPGQASISATFEPDDQRVWEGSSAVVPVTVVKASTTTTASVKKQKSSKRMVVRVRVAPSFSTTATGQTRVVVKRNGKVVKRISLMLNQRGKAKAKLMKMARGKYVVKAKYAGNTNLRKSSTTRTLKVK